MRALNQLFGPKAPTCQHNELTDPLDLEWEVYEVREIPRRCWECGRVYSFRIMTGNNKETYTDKVWEYFNAETNPARRKVYAEFLALKPDHITGRDMRELSDQLHTATNSMGVQ